MTGLLLIAQLSIVAHAPDSVRACEAFEVSVAVSVPGRSAPELVTPSFGPFEVLRSSSAPHITLDPRGERLMAEYRYIVTTDRVGVTTLAPFEARAGGGVTRSRPIVVTVRSSAGMPQVPMVVARAGVDTGL